MLINLRLVKRIISMVTKLPIKVTVGIVVSREPNPHPPNTPVIIDGRLVKISHSLILNSLKLAFQSSIFKSFI